MPYVSMHLTVLKRRVGDIVSRAPEPASRSVTASVARWIAARRGSWNGAARIRELVTGRWVRSAGQLVRVSRRASVMTSWSICSRHGGVCAEVVLVVQGCQALGQRQAVPEVLVDRGGELTRGQRPGHGLRGQGTHDGFLAAAAVARVEVQLA